MMTPPICNPMIPLVHPIPGGMFPGRMLRFQGFVPTYADRFEINLQTGPNSDADDIAFHFNPRFPERVIVRNHRIGNWGPEDRNGGMPLVPGMPFEALILCEPNSIKVALNGAHFCDFPHRVPYQRISYLTVKGDVTVSMISFVGTYTGDEPTPRNKWYICVSKQNDRGFIRAKQSKAVLTVFTELYCTVAVPTVDATLLEVCCKKKHTDD